MGKNKKWKMLEDGSNYIEEDSNKLKWEKIEDKKNKKTSRMKIENGWLYRTIVYGGYHEDGIATSMVFVPDNIKDNTNG